MKQKLFQDRAAWRAWLTKNHGKEKELWLVYYKKGSGGTSVTYVEALEEALCFGWIDSTVNRLDEKRYMQRYTPRNEKSIWSAANKARVERLIASGRMAGPGLAKIEAARKNGSWTRLDLIDRDRKVPADLTAALAGDPAAQAAFDRVAPSQKKLWGWWVDSAKRPETRARRIALTLAGLKEGRRPGM